MGCRPHYRSLLVAITLLLIDCGGSSTTPTSDRTLAKAGGDNQTAAAGAAVAIAPSVKIVDENGQPVSGIGITFAVASGGGGVTGAAVNTGADGVARVGSWTLGPAAGVNTLTATAAGTGISGNPVTFTATGQESSFEPTTSTTLSGGVYNYSDVMIPAGVIVTITGDVTINTAGLFTLVGSLVGNCVGVTVHATGVLTLNGAISNTCAPIPSRGAPAIHLVGEGGYTVNNGSTTSSGAVDITNDTSLTDADFAASRAAARPHGAAALSTGPSCQFVHGTFIAAPDIAASGADGVTGTPGQPGSSWSAACRGDMAVTGLFTVVGQSGGPGGNGIDVSASATAVGGPGGDGGNLKLRATGDIEFEAGSATTLRSGSGGAGGNASATASSSSGSAEATGANGVAPGLIQVLARGTITIDAPLTLSVGQGGNGGNADAEAANGAPGAAGCPARIGGEAAAAGGDGGSTPDKMLVASNVSGLSQVSVTGGNPGRGGNALGRAGNGGDGAQACPDAGSGGDLTVIGGGGGEALLADQNSQPVHIGGNGGSATFAGANGGNGYNACPTADDGGAGGDGGRPEGDSGPGGTSGAGPGTAGAIVLNMVANGGKGGSGAIPGNGGRAPTSAIGANSVPVLLPPNLTAGARGATCAGIVVTAVTAYSNQFQETVTQANLSVIPITITATILQGVNGDVLLTPGATDEGVTGSLTAPQTSPAGTVITDVITVDNAAIGDHTINFTASATVAGNLVTGHGSFIVHVAGGNRYSVSILENNDPDDVETGTMMEAVEEIAVLEEMIGTTPKVSVFGLMIGHQPISLVRSGSDAFDGLGNFLASVLNPVPVTGHGKQAAAITIHGTIANGSITFSIQINATTAATFQFREADYGGAGSQKP